MGLTTSINDAATFDQAKWCTDALAQSKVDRKDVQRTFQYVKSYHPFFGCAKPVDQLPEWTGKESLEQLAELADAVTVICFEQIGDEGGTRPDDAEPHAHRKLNTTAVANCAYVALNHSKFAIRKQASETINRWRAVKLQP